MTVDEPKSVFRFAPSPNGELHLGHAYSALLNLKMARAVGGKCLLRIEDIDRARCTPDLEKQMLEDLEWIGFEWDEEPRRQSEHFGEYKRALKLLLDRGLVYPAVLSRSDIKKRVFEKEASGVSWPCDPDGSPLYPGEERSLTMEQRSAILHGNAPYALRLDMEKAIGEELYQWQETDRIITADPSQWGDVILARKDTPASYHLCCVMDDALQGVTHVVRGKDLYHATSVHVLLQALFGYLAPVYKHHDLILSDDGEKLSKSRQSVSIRTLKESGKTPAEVVAMLGL